MIFFLLVIIFMVFLFAKYRLAFYYFAFLLFFFSRGTISLHGANIHTEDACNFIVSNGGGTQTFHLRASSEVERQRWVTALELAKAQAQRSMDGNSGGGSSEDESELQAGFDGEMGAEITKQELANVVKALSARLEDLTTCSNLIGKQLAFISNAKDLVRGTNVANKPKLVPEIK